MRKLASRSVLSNLRPRNRGSSSASKNAASKVYVVAMQATGLPVSIAVESPAKTGPFQWLANAFSFLSVVIGGYHGREARQTEFAQKVKTVHDPHGMEERITIFGRPVRIVSTAGHQNPHGAAVDPRCLA